MEERRWLHDKYERLSAEEGQLAGTRTSFFSAIASVLFTGMLVLLVNLLDRPMLFAEMETLLAIFGILISVVWALLLHRTADAQELWRESARRLETLAPPIGAPLPAPIPVTATESVSIDLTRPFLAHQERFSPTHRLSWFDRYNPIRLSEALPIALVVLWCGAMAAGWIWALGSA